MYHSCARWLAISLLVIPLLVAPAQAASASPNVVLIVSDDQAWTDYGFMGHRIVETPHLDQLAREGVLFRRGYVPTALCRPSLMTLITGRYAHQHGITGNDPSPKYAANDSDLYRERRAQMIDRADAWQTLPDLLLQRGYLSFQSGKWWEGSYQRGGFTHGMTRGFPQPGGRHGDDGLAIGREGLQPIKDFVNTALGQEKPFFLWYAPFLPHTPHNPPERLQQKYRRHNLPDSVADYYAMCEWFDETCGELLAFLDDLNLRENTLVAYVCDNGWIQDPSSPRYAPRSKQTPYEGGVRTPIIFRWPGRLRPADRPDLVSSIDFFPTLAAAAGLDAPTDLPGLNLLPYLEENTALPRDTIFGEGYAHDVASLENREASLLYRWVIEGPWKLLLTYDGEVNRYASTHPRTEKRPQLFHLPTDPHEKWNLAGRHPKRVARLAKKISDWYPVRERRVLTSFD